GRRHGRVALAVQPNVESVWGIGPWSRRHPEHDERPSNPRWKPRYVGKPPLLLGHADQEWPIREVGLDGSLVRWQQQILLTLRLWSFPAQGRSTGRKPESGPTRRDARSAAVGCSSHIPATGTSGRKYR